MEDLLLSKDSFLVESSFGNYNVKFIKFKFFLDSLDVNKTFLVVDQSIFTLFKDSFSHYPESKVVIINSSEKTKSFEYSSKLINDLIDRKIKKDNLLVAIGGGTLQDITAFVSSMLFRGIKWSFVPTTLLAQCDSCIGSKTSINFKKYKNVLGNFYPPLEVIIDESFIEFLPNDEIKSGIGEKVHYFYFADSTFLKKIFLDYKKIIKREKSLLPFIKESLKIKKEVIEVDEFDKGIRNHFQFGHTFGHAIETATKYRINHGQAVTLGISISMYISMKNDLLSKELFLENHQLISVNFPDFRFQKFDFNLFWDALIKSKNNIEDYLVCILIKKPGYLKKSSILINDDLKFLLKEYFMEFHN